MQRAAIEQILPEVMREAVEPGGPLGALLNVMAELHEPAELVLADIDRYFDPLRAPAHFLPLLARWLDLGRVLEAHKLPLGEHAATGVATTLIAPGRLRELIRHCAYLSRWRGTSHALVTFLGISTGCAGFTVLEGSAADGSRRSFHILVRAPVAARSQQVLIERIIEAEKPAYVTCELEFAADVAA